MIHNPVIDCILARRSTRDFEPTPIPPEQLETILNAAIWAPSGSNSQSWLFTAIQKPEVMAELQAILRTAFAERYVPDDDYPAKHSMKNSVTKEGYQSFNRAPVLIIASNRPHYENAMADCALALENIFLAAQSLGLGSCYINQLHWATKDPPLRDFLAGLGIPKEHVICSSAAIGVIRKESLPPQRKANTFQII
jgi:nitroreductase